ncbi:hypothetical protein [Adhaeribacter pallidiroseus]|uniref:Outer membrane protein beta-barrel domain-containing protein n=1 Tax=Adhaeribacter pallidiroseus TaxID=2072847 RepID=A0A369QJI2_9BACT|nr:hypothetical protein [Adhaeribacter pallidiroseus]RDC63785.1 hypothetical protein AHMF7616_02394 [Adhaeribacter pallidiroseus]
MKNLPLVLITTLGLQVSTAPNGQAQEREKEITLAYGPFQQTTLDKQASPLLYKSHHSNTATFTFINRTPRSQFHIRLNPGWGSYAPDRFKARTYGDEDYVYSITPTLYVLNLKIGYLRKFNKPHKPNFLAGAELAENLFISDQIANTYWATSIASLNLIGQRAFKISNRQKITAQVSMPVIAAVSRFNYANFPKSTDGSNFVEFFRQGTELVSMNKLQQINLEARYSYSLSQRFQVGLNYQFSWLHYPEPRTIRTYSQALLFQTSYRFKFREA